MKTLHTFALVVVTCAFTACPKGPDVTDDGGSRRDGGSGGGAGQEAFAKFDLDVNARENAFFAMAIDPGTERVGVVYFTPNGTFEGNPDGGAQIPNYDLKYVEFNNGTASAPERLRKVQRMIGLSLAFDPVTHEPVTAFLGGDDRFVMGKSNFWFQNDASVMRKLRATGAWRETVIATESPSGCSPIDVGFLVGLWSSIAFDSTGKLYVAFRDGHNGQFPQQDWGGSDVEIISGTSETGALTRTCMRDTDINTMDDTKQAYGGRMRLVIGKDDEPAVIYDQEFGGANVPGSNVLVQQRDRITKAWSSAFALLNISDTMSGAVFAYDPIEGYGVAVTDRVSSQLLYTKSPNGVNWSVTDQAYGDGTGGWYPSLAMDPVNHEPAIAFYFCSPRGSVVATNCLQSDDELRVTQRIANNWRQVVVDTEGGWQPKLGFFASGKRVVVYRTPPSLSATAQVNPTAGQLKIAVEK